MKKVYVITCTLEANKNLEFTLSDVKYVFSSEKKANKQLDVIKKAVIEGKWWSDSNGNPLYGKILSDQYFVNRHGSHMRDVVVELPNGLKEIYRISQLDLNSGFGINF
jgi:hypothetical protein